MAATITFRSVLPLGDEIEQIRGKLVGMGFDVLRVKGRVVPQTILCKRCGVHHDEGAPHTVNPGMVGRKVWTG